jgi:hypothetical protein
MFQKTHIDALIKELRDEWDGKPEFEKIIRDAHLAIALFDAGRPLQDDIDPNVAALIQKHKPAD